MILAARALRNNDNVDDKIENDSEKSDALEEVLFDAARSDLESELRELQ